MDNALNDCISTLMASLSQALSAVSSKDGMPDHKVRLAAAKELRALLVQMLPSLNEADKTKIASLITDATRLEAEKLRAMAPAVQNYVVRK